jgi:hypothetical protein
VEGPSNEYFSGKLLDAESLTLEQSYVLEHEPGSATAVWLELDVGSGFEAWYEVPDFLCSRAEDRHFVLDRETATVRFGDGERGRTPPSGAAFRGWYRFGGGAIGNVPWSRSELALRLAEVSHFSWMRQSASEKEGVLYEDLDPRPTEHDRERGKDVLGELERIGILRCKLE